MQRYFAINFGDWLVVATGYVGYFVLGQFLRGVRLNGAQKMTAFWLMVLLYAAGAGATYHLTVRNGGKLDDFFFLDWSPNMIAVSVLTFLWIKSLPYEKYFERFGALRPALARVSALSFGIYFMHLMVYEGLSNGYFGLRLNEHSFNPLAGSCLTVFAVLLIAGVITAVLQKIPITREIVPGDWAGPTTPATAESAEIAEARQEPVHLTSAKLW